MQQLPKILFACENQNYGKKNSLLFSTIGTVLI